MQDHIQKERKQKGLGVPHVIRHLLGEGEALSSNPSTTKKKKKKAIQVLNSSYNLAERDILHTYIQLAVIPFPSFQTKLLNSKPNQD
jgi:hypothetical protein